MRGRPKKPIERFDPDTLWPLAVYDCGSQAAAAGFNRSAIVRAIKEGWQHKGYGWRYADANSRVPEYIIDHYQDVPNAALDDCVDLLDFIQDYRWGRIDRARVRTMLEGQYGIGKRIKTVCGPRSAGQEIHLDIEVVIGLVPQTT